MKIFLLTHEREVSKANNTGKIAQQTLGAQVEIIIWQRKQPSLDIMTAIENNSIALLYLTEQSVSLEHAPHYENYIILDGTWQEARKIYNKSAYLQHLPTLSINSKTSSIYTLRRNQKTQGLCTAESVIEVLKNTGEQTAATTLLNNLHAFLAS